MTDSERELYQRTVADCNAVADSMDPDDGLSRPFRTLAQVLQRRLDRVAPEQPRPQGSGVTRGHLHAVPTQEAG